MPPHVSPVAKVINNLSLIMRKSKQPFIVRGYFADDPLNRQNYLPPIILFSVATQTAGSISAGDLVRADYTGRGIEADTGAWRPGGVVGRGWDHFPLIAAEPRGSIIAVDPNGAAIHFLYDFNGAWKKSNEHFADGWNLFDRLAISQVMCGWDLSHIFARGKNGDLHWGLFSSLRSEMVLPLRVVDVGWNRFRKICCSSDGVIFALTPSGNLHYYQAYWNLNQDSYSIIPDFQGWRTEDSHINKGWGWTIDDMIAGPVGDFEAIYTFDKWGGVDWYSYTGKGRSDPEGVHGWVGPHAIATNW